MSDSKSSGSGQRPLRRPDYGGRPNEAGALNKPEVRRAAYHEAAHIVVAVVAGLEVLPCGIRINTEGSGMSDYEGAGYDVPISDERVDAVVMALLAGGLGQSRFDSTVAPNTDSDDYRIGQLIGGDSTRRNRLQDQADETLTLHWDRVEQLAQALLARNRTSTRFTQSACGRWTMLPTDKYIEGFEVAQLLSACLQIGSP